LSATATELGGGLRASAPAADGKVAEAAAAPPETAREGTDAIGGRGVRRERRREHQPRRGREEDSMSSCGRRRGVDEGDNTDKGWCAQVLEGNRAAISTDGGSGLMCFEMRAWPISLPMANLEKDNPYASAGQRSEELLCGKLQSTDFKTRYSLLGSIFSLPRGHLDHLTTYSLRSKL
jgi:hypothetical protein